MADTTDTTPATESSQLQDAPQQVDMDFGVAIERIDSWIDGSIRLLPNLIVALIFLFCFILWGGWCDG